MEIIENFRHKTEITIRTFDVDSYGIVHNSVYLKYLEIGRIEYRKSFGYKVLKSGLFNDGLKVIVVNNSIDYKYPAYTDETLTVYTRISWIKSSSFCFEQIITNNVNSTDICEGRGILVNINPVTNIPEPLPGKFIEEIQNFEKNLELRK
jgi:acyl-CoA thioester hydrolase